jgi:RNA polymerase sigma factor (sigma-70 family)
MISDDMALVREYAQSNSEQAFTTLVSRHVNLVYSVALRQVLDPNLAEEIAQVVFIILARKSKSLSPKIILSGWLCRTARYVTGRALRTERRRQFREQESHMQSLLNEPDSDAWQHIAPLLDEALNCLGTKEHDAVVLRFFDGKELKQVGAVMGTTEDAARMRVNRGLETLRTFFTKRGVTLSVTAISGAVSAYSVQAAPAALASSLKSIALANGASASASAIALTQATIRALAWAKAQVVAATCGVALAAGVLTAVLYRIVAPNEQAQGFQVKGEVIRETAHSRGDTLTGEKSFAKYSFVITVNGPRWFLHVECDDPLRYDYSEVAFDGKLLYYVSSLKSWVRTQKRAGKSVGPNTAVGIVENRQVPQIGANDELGPIWLAYASANFFRTHTNLSATPTPATLGVGGAGLSGTLDYYHQTAIVRSSGRTPGIPQEAIYVEEEPSKRYSQSFTNTVFRVEGYTNIGSASIPNAATFTTYFPLKRAAGAPIHPEPQYVYRLRTTAVGTGRMPGNGRPKRPELTYVSDLRFADDPKEPVKLLHYYAKGRLYSDSQVRSLPEYASALAKVEARNIQ